MKDRGKSVAVSNSSNCFSDSYYSWSSDLPCRKHSSSSSSSVGICAYCLKDRLVKLVCSDCGEQRLSSCSCSDISSSNPSSCVLEVGSVGRVSFLLENDNKEDVPHSSKKPTSMFLRRSSSTSTYVKKGGGFWRVGRFFRKQREKDYGFPEVGEKDEMWDFDCMGITRSKSISGLRCDLDDFVKNGHANSDKRRGGLIELDGSFNGEDDSGFIDIKFGYSSDSKPEFSLHRSADDVLESKPSGVRGRRDGESRLFDYLADEDRIFSNSRSCRVSVDDKGVKKCRKSFKVLRWILKRQPSNGGRPSLNKYDE